MDKASGGISLIPPEKTTENEENSDPALNWKPSSRRPEWREAASCVFYLYAECSTELYCQWQ
jgi:hypothetical protein